jgi:fused signal recognition particle receptor
VLVAIAERFALPVVAIGVGESAEDLAAFDARQFADALLGITR